jgi:hypothetical protein
MPARRRKSIALFSRVLPAHREASYKGISEKTDALTDSLQRSPLTLRMTSIHHLVCGRTITLSA